MSKPNDEELLVDLWEGIESEETQEEVEETVDSQEDLEDVDEQEVESTEEDESEEDVVEDDEEEQEEETDSDEEAEELSLVESIRQSLGYDVEGDFDDTEEGIQLLVERATEKATESSVESYFSKYPEVKELKDYIELGGDPDDFLQTKFPEVDYTKVELNEGDESQQEKIVRQELAQVRGMSTEEINAEIEDYKNGGILENKAKRSLSSLKNKQQEEQVNLVEKQKEEKEQYLQQVQDHWNNVENTLKEKTELKGIKIPSKDKDAFFDYLSKPVKEGKSQAMIKQEEADLETRLLIDYMLYKDLKFSDLITRAAKDQNAKTLRSRMKQAQTRRKADERSPEYTEEFETI